MSAQGAASAPPSRKKQEDKLRKKDPKSWENISKTISSMDDAGKLAYLQQKYKDLYEDNRSLVQNNQFFTRQCSTLQQERDHSQTELTKSIVGRARLESLCRELQKQNKQIKDENIQKIKEEEDRRKEVSLTFADKLSDINQMMDENKEKSEKLREENLKMTAKLSELYTQFQKREEDIAKMSKQLDLERQFSQATLKKMELEIQAEKELHTREQILLKKNLEKSEANCAVLVETVKGLQDHIDVYKNQYEDFESTMAKSAKVFDNFKFEISTMTKQVNTLEQEALSWKTKFHDSMKALVEVSEAKKNQDCYLQSLDRKNEQLNKLCRQLQMDRSNYLKLLKANGIDPGPSILSKEPSGEEEVPKKTPMTKKEKELHLLKENLKAMQNQLSRLSTDDDKQEAAKADQSSQIVEDGAKSLEAQVADQEKVNGGSPEPVPSEPVVSKAQEDVALTDPDNKQPDEPNEAKN